jgi:hypothetical protein
MVWDFFCKIWMRYQNLSNNFLYFAPKYKQQLNRNRSNKIRIRMAIPYSKQTLTSHEKINYCIRYTHPDSLL